MAIQELKEVQSMLIGISFMHGKIETQLQQVWMERFSGNKLNIMLIEECKDIDEACDKVIETLQGMGIEEVSGRLLISVFVDLTDDAQVPLLKEMDELYSELEDLLGCSILEFLIFDHVGAYKTVWRREPDKEQLRSIVRSSVYKNMRTLVVGRTPLMKMEKSWRGEIALLDVLARGDMSSNLYFCTGTLGFVKYGDSNQGMRHRCMHRLEELNRLLSDAGEDSLKTELINYLEENLRKPLTKACSPVNGIMPVPKQIIGSSSFWGKAPEADIDRTNKALLEVQDSMHDYIVNWCNKLKQEIPNVMDQMFADTKTGILLMNDEKAAFRIFSLGDKPETFSPFRLQGKYKIVELENEIYASFRNNFTQELKAAEMDICQAFSQAFTSIPLEEIEHRKMVYEQERTDLNERMKKLPASDNFAFETLNSQHFDSVFRPRNTSFISQENKALLFSGNDLMNDINEKGCPSEICLFYYLPITGYESVEALSTFMYKETDEKMDMVLEDIIY